MTVTLNSRLDLTLENCRAVAWGREAVELGPGANAKIARARQDFLRLIEDPAITIYGVNTGYGHQASQRLNAAERKVQAKRPTHHRAVSWGDPLPERVVRAIVFARLANFVEGHAAVSPGVVDGVVAMLNGGDSPLVPARGQGGAGEILSLSHLFIELAARLPLAEKDMISLVNGSPAASALIADAALSARPRLEIAAEVLALAAEAFNAPHGHFAAELENYWNNPHDAWALATLRQHMAGGRREPRRPYQAPVSIRILPRILGQAKRAAAEAETIARQSLMAVSDNPVVIPEAERLSGEAVISTGGYHNIQAAAGLDALTASYANIAVVTGRIAAKLLDEHVSLLPAQLGYGEGRSYLGCLPMAIVGYEEELRMLAQPTLLPGSESGGFGQDDIASPVFLAWSKFERAGRLVEQALASLAPIAVRAFTVTSRSVPPALGPIAALTAACFPDDDSATPFGVAIARLAGAFGARIGRI